MDVGRWGERRRTGWVIGAFAVVLAVSGGVVVLQDRGPGPAPAAVVTPGSSSAPPVPPSPVPASSDPVVVREPAGPLLPGAGSQPVYLQVATAVYRVELATGQVTRTSTPELAQFGSFVAGPGWVLAKMVDSDAGVVVRDGAPAVRLPVGLRPVGRLSPAPGGDVWFQPEEPAGRVRRVVRFHLDGTAVAGQTITVPARWGLLVSDAAGQLVRSNAAGSYRVSPDGVELLTRGVPLALGAHHLLVWDCDGQARCDAYRLDRRTGRRSLVAVAGPQLISLNQGADPTAPGVAGELSADGRYAALQVPDPDGRYRLHVLDLVTGRLRTLPGELTVLNPNTQLGWTANSRWLLALTDGRVRAYDAVTDTTRTLPLTAEPVLHLTLLGASGN